MLTEKLLAIDPVIIAVYLVVSLLLGIFGSRLLGMNNSKEDDYYLAGRKMPGWLNGMSVAATALNSDVAPLYCGIAVVTGLSGWERGMVVSTDTISSAQAIPRVITAASSRQISFFIGSAPPVQS